MLYYTPFLLKNHNIVSLTKNILLETIFVTFLLSNNEV